MTDKPRPLGVLEVSEYYTAGSDASSCIAIPGIDKARDNIQYEMT